MIVRGLRATEKMTWLDAYNWSTAGPVTPNPERESVVAMAMGNMNRQPLAA